MIEIYLSNSRIVLPHESNSTAFLRGYVQSQTEISDKYIVSLVGKASIGRQQHAIIYKDSYEIHDWMHCGSGSYRAHFAFEIPANLPPTLLPLVSSSCGTMNAQIEYSVIASTVKQPAKCISSSKIVELVRSCAIPRSKVCWGTTKSSAWQYEIEFPSTITISGGNDGSDGMYSVLVRVRSRRAIQLKPESSCFIHCQVVETLSASHATPHVLLDTIQFLAAPSQSWISGCQIPITLNNVRPSISSQLFDIQHILLLKLEFVDPFSGRVVDQTMFSIPLTVLGSEATLEHHQQRQQDKAVAISSSCASKDSDSDSGVWLSS